MLRTIVFVFICLYSSLSLADKFSPESTYRVCFTPAENCSNLIVNAIDQAQKQIRVQAYSFTSAPIAKALVKAYKRGVDVKIILDKSQFRQRGFSSAKFFADYRLPLLIDYKPSIAHSKVMIIDSKMVITGSFNFTRAAQERNTENLLIISDPILAKRYLSNWEERSKLSESVPSDHSPFS